jgi:LCP family protein required for cell wall assembly
MNSKLTMNKSTLSLAFGMMLALMAVGLAFAGISLVRPGWLRAIIEKRASSPAVAWGTVPAPDSSGQPGIFTTVTPVPLPTSAPGTATVCDGPDQITIALLGVDDREGDYSKPTRTDAISVVNVRFPAKSAAVLSIPRDLYVPLPNLESAGITQARINTAYLYGEVYGVSGGGPAEIKQTIELNFGVRVHRYVLVNFGAFVAFVDALGGIDVDVPTAIYDPQFPTADDSGTFVFEVPAGQQHMDGLTALRYARTRHQDDDYQRIKRQQLVMLAIRDKLLSPSVIPQLPALIGTMRNLVQTDLTAEEIAALACLGPQIERTDIRAYAITGDYILSWVTPGGGQVSIPNRDALGPMVQEFLEN